MSHVFNVPVAKLGGETVTVTVSDAGLLDNAAHGLRQRINDATAAMKRRDYGSDEEFKDAVRDKIDPVIQRIMSDSIGRRSGGGTAAALAKLLSMTDEELARHGLQRREPEAA